MLVKLLMSLSMCRQKLCIGNAIVCHKKAGEDACEHLECIKNTGCCLKGAGVKPPPFMVCIIASILLLSFDGFPSEYVWQ